MKATDYGIARKIDLEISKLQTALFAEQELHSKITDSNFYKVELGSYKYIKLPVSALRDYQEGVISKLLSEIAAKKEELQRFLETH